MVVVMVVVVVVVVVAGVAASWDLTKTTNPRQNKIKPIPVNVKIPQIQNSVGTLPLDC
jgi:Rieske Fe-S protein